jgi:hypothetical protein
LGDRTEEYANDADQLPFRGPLFDGNAPSEAALAAVESHPRFEEALRIVAGGVVAQYRGNRITNMVMTDRGRFLIGVFAVHFHHASRPDDPLSGLTIARMRRVCAEQGICSPGRTEAMMMMMRVFGYLAAAPNERDRRMHRLTPTERLLEWHRHRLTFTFDALALLMPEGGAALSRLHSLGFVESFTSHLARAYLAGLYYVDHVPDMRIFLERNAGLVTLFSLTFAGDADDTIPPARPVRVSMSALGRNFGVSRAHVRRMLQDAARDGLIQRDDADGDTITILPRLAAAYRRALAMYLVHHAHGVRGALAELPETAAVA